MEKKIKNKSHFVLDTESPLISNNKIPNQVWHDLSNAKRGFTLIELLVVVLIIGILAAVALPQYNKAVRKARLSEVASTFNSISKGIDMWLEENDGYPARRIYFSGINKTANLDIDISCISEDDSACYTKVGAWNYWCEEGRCHIDLLTSYNADKNPDNKWLDEIHIPWIKYSGRTWDMSDYFLQASPATPDVCRWWKNLYGNGRVVIEGVPGNLSAVCDRY